MSDTAPGRWGDPEFHEWWASEYNRRANELSPDRMMNEHEPFVRAMARAQLQATLAVSTRLRIAADRERSR